MKTNTRTLMLLMCLAVMSTAWAESINEQQARQIAARFMTSRAIPSTGMRLASKAPRMNTAPTAAADKAAYYVFNGTAGGYVIVAGDDRVPAVLGYNDKGTFDGQDIPEAMQELLDGYAAQVEALSSGTGTAAVHLSARPAIAPMVHAQFSQNAPYYTMLPFLSTGKHAVVGCVATAMAQVLHYWKYPASTTRVIPSYTTEDLSIFMPSLPVTDLHMDIIKDSYLYSDSTSAQGMAAARLSLYCAQAVQMDFHKKSSSANTSDIPQALKSYFGYKSTVKYVMRTYYTTQQWEEMLYNELAARRPVVYRGGKDSGGHAFVCDGYDGNGMFHINWGWNGMSNGYFVLNVLNPDAQGTGGIDGNYGYVMDQAMVVGIEPGTSPTPELEVIARSIEVQNYTGSRTSHDANFTADVVTQFMNISDEAIGFDYGWGLYHDGTMLKVIASGYRDNLNPWYYTTQSRTLAFGGGLGDGTYRLLPIYCAHGSNAWKPCIGSDVNYVDIIIAGNNASITAYGRGTTPSYKVNNIDVKGLMHVNRPVSVTLNLTNTGNTRSNVLYVLENGAIVSGGLIDIEPGSTGEVYLEYMTQQAGSHVLTFALDDKGNNAIASRTLDINEIPEAHLTCTATALNVTDRQNKIMTSDKFSVKVAVTNQGATTYHEDITVKLFKSIYGNYGSNVQTLSRTVELEPGGTTTLQFDLDNVVDGWKYFAKVYCYSSNEQASLVGVSTYTIVFPTPTGPVKGDVNGDGEAGISDVNALVDYIISGNATGINLEAADCNGDHEVNISDVNALIDIITK